MQVIEPLTTTVASGDDLSDDQASAAAELLTRPEIPSSAKQDFLRALARKGETVTEVAAFARTFRGFAVDPGVEAWADRAIDVCGTGGDGSGTFNISTAVSFVVAASGVPVFKHGNRSITSKCGSADLLRELGVRVDAPHDVLRQSLDELNFCFFFAPAFHPAFKEIMSTRKALAEEGQRSIFNLLGPLINPGHPAFQLLGVYSPNWVRPLADVLDALGLQGGWVVHGEPEPGRALDELSCAGGNRVGGFGAQSAAPAALTAGDAGLPDCGFSDLAGGDVTENLSMMYRLFNGAPGDVPVGLRNSVLLNAGAALLIAGAAADLPEGVERAKATVDSGAVDKWLGRVREFYSK